MTSYSHPGFGEKPESVVQVTNCDSNGLHHLKMFPVELWKMIIKKIKDPVLFKAVVNSSHFFQDLFKTDRTVKLFPLVWKIFSQKIQNNQLITTSATHSTEKCTACGRIRKKGGFKYSIYLDARAVCKTWNKCVDNGLNNEIQYGGYGRWTTTLYSSDLAGEFLDHFKSYDTNAAVVRNPFVGRSLQLVLQIDEDADHVDLMLKKFGHHIFECTILDDANLTVGFVFQLRSWLFWMPNLKRLKIDFLERALDYDELRRELRENVLPIMKNLLCLELCRVPTPLLKELIDQTSQLHELTLENLGEHLQGDLIDSFRKLDLEILNVESYKHDDVVFLDSALDCPHLKVLNMILYRDFAQWSTYFMLLSSHWRDSLETVFLQLPEAIIIDDEVELICRSVDLSLDLRNIKQLTLSMFNVVSLDFLLSLKNSLEILILELRCDVNSRWKYELICKVVNEQTLKIWDYKHRMLESNIWVELSTLQQLELMGYLFVNPEVQEYYGDQVPKWMLESEIEDNESFVCYGRLDWNNLHITKM